MSFVNSHLLTYAIVAILIITLLLNRLNSRYFKWIRSYWFYERTWTSKLASFFYILSLFLFMISLLDLRGPEKKVRASLPDQRTIILLDTSASMLAEDVRPNRFVKSLQIARHFVKNAPGHQISIVLFSDIQKRLIPFTDDIDLVDSRLAALEKTNSVAGGSNISHALAESISYFEESSDDEEKALTGNILLFTDAEESEGEFKIKVPGSISLAAVGVGTLKGGNIPLRYEDGNFRGYKTFKGEPVVTRLDEDHIKKLGRNVQNFKYWIANSYSLPTEEIMNFFRTSYKKKQSSGDIRVRPVYSHYLLIPAIIFYCLSVFIGRFAHFKIPKILMLLFTMGMLGANSPLSAQEQSEVPSELTREIQADLEFIKKGKASRDYVLKTAEKMLKAKDDKRAVELYDEYAKNSKDEKVRFNHVTALLKADRFKDALPVILELNKNSKDADLKNKLRQNLNHYLEQKKKEQEQQKNQQNQENKEQQKNNQDQQGNNQQGNKGNSQEQNKENNQQQNKDDKENKEKSGSQSQSPQKNGKSVDEQNKNKKENKDPSRDEKKGENEGDEQEKDEKSSGPSTLEEKEKEIEQKRRMVKTPATVKQIMSDDRELQKKMMDTSTNQRGEMKPKRDW